MNFEFVLAQIQILFQFKGEFHYLGLLNLDDYPKLQEWYFKLKSRPSFKNLLKRFDHKDSAIPIPVSSTVKIIIPFFS